MVANGFETGGSSTLLFFNSHFAVVENVRLSVRIQGSEEWHLLRGTRVAPITLHVFRRLPLKADWRLEAK